jgi:hypothetical protein
MTDRRGEPDLSPEDVAWIAEKVASWPPLTEEQKTVIRQAFRS